MLPYYFEVLFTGRQIFIVICSIFIGFLIGHSRIGFFWKLLLSLPILFVQFSMFVSADTVEALSYLLKTGAVGQKVSSALFTLSLTHPAVYLLSWGLGAAGRVQREKELQEKLRTLTGADLMAELNIIAAHPDLSGSGWFAQRWLPMGDDERLAWAKTHRRALCDLWFEAGDEGLQSLEFELPQRLALIDANTRR